MTSMGCKYTVIEADMAAMDCKCEEILEIVKVCFKLFS